MKKRPIIIASLAQKGGVGKSTIVVHLSTVTGGKTKLIETDQQSSCADWHHERKLENPQFYPYADFANQGIERLIARSTAEGSEYIVIDTPPHSNPSTAGTIQHADVLVIPTEASMFPLKSLRSTLAMVRAANKPAVLVLNKAVKREQETAEAIEALSGLGMPLVVIHQRVAFKRALPTGLTALEYKDDPQAIAEIRALWEAIEGVLK